MGCAVAERTVVFAILKYLFNIESVARPRHNPSVDYQLGVFDDRGGGDDGVGQLELGLATETNGFCCHAPVKLDHFEFLQQSENLSLFDLTQLGISQELNLGNNGDAYIRDWKSDFKKASKLVDHQIRVERYS